MKNIDQYIEDILENYTGDTDQELVLHVIEQVLADIDDHDGTALYADKRNLNILSKYTIWWKDGNRQVLYGWSSYDAIERSGQVDRIQDELFKQTEGDSNYYYWNGECWSV